MFVSSTLPTLDSPSVWIVNVPKALSMVRNQPTLTILQVHVSSDASPPSSGKNSRFCRDPIDPKNLPSRKLT